MSMGSASTFTARGIDALNDNISFTGDGQADISASIQKLFDSFNINQAKLNYEINAGISGDNASEYLKNLEKVILEIDKINNKSAKGLTDSEKYLYDNLKC